MPPKTQRSRACTQCRDRRVKCDETPGFCERCRRLGLSCSGPVALAFIDMTDKVTKPRRTKKKEIGPSEKHSPKNLQLDCRVSDSAESLAGSDLKGSPTPISASSSLGTSPQTERQLLPGEHKVLIFRTQYRLPTYYQPSMADAFDQLFISHFVALNTGIRSYNAETPWIALLPGLSTTAKTPALKYSLRAAAMALYGKVHREAPILVDSYRWYGYSLINQHKALAKLKRGAIPSQEECLAPVILGLYEVYAGTSPSTVFQHLAAAARILAMRGPRNCSSGDSLPLFIALRVSEAHKAIVFNKPSVFASPEWMTLPFLITPKNAHMHLTDILLGIPGCISLSGVEGTLRGFFSSPIPPHNDLDPVRTRTTQLLHQLDLWAERHPHLCTTVPISQITTEDMTTPIDTSIPPPSFPAVMLPDTFVAMTTAAFKAARLILTLLLHKVSENREDSSPISVPDDDSSTSLPSNATLLTNAASYAKDILEITTYMEATHPLGFNFLRCMFALTVVAILGPVEEDQRHAREMLARWGAQRGVGGLSGSWVNT